MGRKKNKNKVQGLPISNCKSKILESVKNHRVTIITGPTGCGKSTQVPKYLYENGYTKDGAIACLHPRCVAAMSLARRLSEEFQSDLGGLVGYQVRFFNARSSETKILFMTMGFLLQLMKFDGSGKYSVIIIDEAHERSIHTDVILGRTKQMLEKDDKLKLVIMSATLDVKEIADFYGSCAEVKVPSTVDRVTVIYRPPSSSDYVTAIRNLVVEIIDSQKKGHVLIFLPSEQKVTKCCRSLRNLAGTRTLPFFSNLDEYEKARVFQEFGNRRKLIVATNVAETSLTIPGVNYVIDSGFVKRVRFQPAVGYERWITEWISVAEAEQRKGRTGRTGLGTCYRLYDECRVGPEMHKDRFSDWPEPEIWRADLGALVLSLGALKVEDALDFPFVVPPRPHDISWGIKLLQDLSLLHGDSPEPPSNDDELAFLCDSLVKTALHDNKREGDIGNDDELPNDGAMGSNYVLDSKARKIQLTALGEAASTLPLDPRLAKVFVIAKERLDGADRDNVLAIIAMQSVRSVAGLDAEDDLLACRDLFWHVGCSVHRPPSRLACQEAGVDYSPLHYAWRVFQSLHDNIKRSGPRTTVAVPKGVKAHDNAIKKVFLAGFFDHLSVRCGEAGRNAKFLGACLHGNRQEMLLHQQSRLDPTEDFALCIKLQKQGDNKDNLVMRVCTGLNSDMLRALNPKTYKIKVHLWKRVLDQLYSRSPLASAC